ncbi:hypothetical protein COB55_04390 [Candidatus Wolfebacteria bacterium]|nr:MAG: hypothetical protein COB55_04390 [Candidatus Wolfebacteria bacterium]
MDLKEKKISGNNLCEPLRSNRFSIEFFNKSKKININSWTVRNFNLSSVKFDDRKIRGKRFLNFKVELFNVVGNMIKPENLFDVTKIKLDFLDPTGITTDYYLMNVEVDGFNLSGDYSNDELLTYKTSFFVDYLETMEDETIKNN